MAKKARAITPIVNRRALSRREREERYRRWLYIGAGVVLALVVALAAAGLYQSLVVAPASPVATVNGVPIRTDTYQRWVQYRRYDLRTSLARIRSQLAQLDPNNADQQTLYAMLSQQQQELQNRAMSLTMTTLDELIDAELIRQEAARRGLTVTPEEVSTEIEHLFGYNLSQPSPVPTPITATAPITETPTPTEQPMTEQQFKQYYTEYIAELRKNAGFREADFRKLVETSLLRDKLQQAMAAEVPTTAEQVHARHILVDKEEDARAALERIRKGEDFAAVAKEVSTDTGTKDNGGDLGWFPRGMMTEEFEAAAFALQPGQVSDVVQTSYGYHIIKVEERDPNRPLDQYVLLDRQSRALDDWLSAQRKSDAVKRYWSLDKVPKDRTAGS
jgi:parvulin-like peptidyl-prolyl isomerase